MAKARALDKRRKSVRNIRKITRTMELIASAKFKKAMDRATNATDYTNRVTKLVKDLATAGLKVSHPLLDARESNDNTVLLVLSANRGLCGGYNGQVFRAAWNRWRELQASDTQGRLEISGKRGLSAFRFRDVEPDEVYTQFDDQPGFDEVEVIANRYLEWYTTGKIDRLEVVYTRFTSISKQEAAVETLLPLGQLTDSDSDESDASGESPYEFLPSAESILEEVVPASFRVKLFKCFLDAAVSEQIARMVAMKAATENAGEMIKQLSLTYNRARQSQITNEIMEIIGGVEALNK